MLYLILLYRLSHFQFSSVAQSCPPLCNHMDCCTPGFPVHHQLLGLTQTHVHQVRDASNHLILCHPLLLPPSIYPSIRVFSNDSVLHIRWPKYWSFSWFPVNIQDWLVWSPCSLRGCQESSPTPQFKSINSLVLSLLYGPTLSSIHNYWENHSFNLMD